MSEADPTQVLDSNDKDIDIDEVEESGYENGPIYDKIYELAEKFAGTSVGQYVTGKIDRLLKLIEDTAKWSLPPKNKSDSITPLERPLPWIPFIALILMLRLARIGISIAGLFVGNAPLAPSDVVYFIQTRRRKLRAIRVAGMKEIVRKEQLQKHEEKGGVLSGLRSIISMAICRPRLVEDSHNKILVDENLIEEAGTSGVNKVQQNHISYKNQCFEDDDASLTFGQILDKYGACTNEEDDSDFVPPIEALNDLDTSSTSTSSSTSESDEGKNTAEEENEYTESALSISNTNPNSKNITNGNISIESHDLSMEAKENGAHLNTKLRKPKIMPKPIKEEPMPPPIQEIKQEPADSDEYEDTNRNNVEIENPEDQIISNDYNLHQQSIVEQLENDCRGPTNIDITENGKAQKIEKINGDQDLLQQGSPDLCGAYGFQPTSILKNCQAVYLEKRGFEDDFAVNEDFIKGESTNETVATSRPTKSTNLSGKPTKNKFRGKRR